MYIKNLSVILIIIFSVSCSVSKNKQDPSVFSDSLIVIKDASNAKFAKMNGTQQVVYSIIEPYPALNIISEIDNKLKTMGWRALEKDWLNPQIPTSHVRGWTTYIDETKNDNKEVHLWCSNWTNPQNDMLVYSLTYSRQLETDSIMSDLTVVGIYIPRELAKARMSKAR